MIFTFISLSKVSRIINTGGTSSSKCFIIESGMDSIRLYLPAVKDNVYTSSNIGDE